MTTNRYWVEDVLSGVILTQDLPLNDVQVNAGVNRPGSITGTIPVDALPTAELEAFLDEGRRAIYWERDGQLVDDVGGVVWTSGRALGSREIRVEASGWLGYFDHRDIWRDRQFTNTDQFNIFKTLVDDAQDEAYSTALGGPGTSANLGITVTWDALSGVLRNREEDYRNHQAKNLGEALRQLAGVENGFDYGVIYSLNLTTNRINKTIKLFYPQRGRTTNYLFEYEFGSAATADTYVETYEDAYPGSDRAVRGRTNITRWGITRDASKMAWRARGWGDGIETSKLRSESITEARRGVYPPLDVAFKASTGVSVQATLDELTTGELARVDHSIRLPIIEIDPAKHPRWGDWTLGDTVMLRIDDGWGSIGVDVPVAYRIIGWSVKPRENRPVLTLEEV